MERDRVPDADRLNRYWDHLALGQRPDDPATVDGDVAALLERLRMLGEPPALDSARERVWRDLRQHRRWKEAEQTMTTTPLTPAVSLPLPARETFSAAPLSFPARRRLPLPSPWIVAPAVIALLLIGALLAVFNLRGDDGQHAMLPALGTPEAQPLSPDVPMFRGNPGRTGVAAGPGPDGAPVEIWRVPLGSEIQSAPAIVEDTLYVASDGVYALDAATGEERWHTLSGILFSSSPAVDAGLVFAGSESGTLYALAADTGRERWNFPGARPSASPLVVAGVVYTGSEDGFLYAIDQESGEERWRAALEEASSRSPSYAEGLVYIGSADGVLHAIDAASGEERWTYNTGGGILVTAAVANGVIYQGVVSGERNGLHALDAATGAERWFYTPATTDGLYPPAVTAETIFAPGHDGNLYAIDAATGVERWQFATGDWLNAAPAYVGETLYLAGQDQTLYALDAASGAERWRFTLDGPVDYGPVVANGVVYVGTNGGILYAIGGSGEAPVLGDAPPAAATPAAAVAPEPLAFLWRTAGGPEPLTYANVLAIAPDGNLWVTDGGRNQFQIFAPDGTYLETWGEAGSGDGQFDWLRASGEGIASIAFTPDGGFYVADSHNYRIQQFDAGRNFVRAWGSQGTGVGQFLEPNDVDLDASGNVYIIDDNRNDVQVFTPEGEHLLTFGGSGAGDGKLDGPGWGTFDAAGNFWIADAGNNRISQFASDGSWLRSIGQRGSDDGEFTAPQQVALDAAGRIYVTDIDNHRVQVFTPDGEFLLSLTGDGGGGTRFINPVGIAFDGEGNLYLHDWDDDPEFEAVQKFRLLPPLA